MTRELLLLRHGKSDWSAGTDDYQRPLKNRGKRGAQRVGVWLAQQGLTPDLVVSSPAARALATAEKCSKAMGMDARKILQDQRIYLADLPQLLEVLSDCPAEGRRVMLVGHNPGLEQLLIYLSDQPPRIPLDGKLMPTATLARLKLPEDWRNLIAGQGKLQQLMRASNLPKKFPFPSPAGPELRDRPAYYYTQSSVLPYRLQDGLLEILIIRSSKDKHWVIPKGIAEPGHSLQESARKEAWEEAGVEGEVQGREIGSYSYEKWGAACKVTVFPMRVSREIPEEAWEERHRGRQWVTPEQAAALLKQPALGPMITAFVKRFKAA